MTFEGLEPSVWIEDGKSGHRGFAPPSEAPGVVAVVKGGPVLREAAGAEMGTLVQGFGRGDVLVEWDPRSGTIPKLSLTRAKFMSLQTGRG